MAASHRAVLRFPTGRRGASAQAKLDLVEFLLATDDPEACANRATAWLGQHAGVEQSLCLASEPSGEVLTPVGGHGTAPVESEFSLRMDDSAHPLVSALEAVRPVYFPVGAKQPHTPLTDVAFHAFPLRVERAHAERAFALLLASTSGAAIDPDVQWLAEVLAEKLHRIGAREPLASSRFGRERALLYSIINAVTDPILVTSSDGKLLVANARAEKLFTAPEEASEGLRRAVQLNNMLFSAALSATAIQPRRHELLLVDPTEGSDLLFELLSSPARDALGESSFVSVLRNVTDLGRASAELEENYRRLRAAEAEVRAERHRIELVIDSVADPIVVTDPQGDIVLLNTPAERLFTVAEGASDAQVRRVRANDAHFSSFVSNLLFSGTDLRHRGEIGLVEPEGGDGMPVEAIAGKVLSEHGELTWVVTILHDRREAIEKALLYERLKLASDELEAKVQAATAELAHQNELLRRQAIEVEQASAMKSQFLANVSHELRTPLNAILGYTSMMSQGMGGELSEKQRKYLGRVDSNAQHLLSVINEILDITRIEAGRMPLHESSFPLADLLKEVTAELDPLIQRSHLTVDTALEPRLPRLRTDRQKVKQIVLNLLSNALKFTHDGGVRISAGYDARRKMLDIAVADTGIGIAPENHEKVFEDFRQVDNSPTRAYGGTGLGLSICRRLAKMLGGSISLDSALGKGSTFTLHLPLKRKR